MNSWGECSVPIQKKVPLARWTTWGIGGRAAYYAEPKTPAEVGALLWEASRRGFRVFPLGGGSNILVNDALLNGLVINLRGASQLSAIELDVTQDRLRCGAGAQLASVVRAAANAGLAGLASLAGIPGTLGGAVRMNAGGADGWIGGNVSSVIGFSYDGELVRRSVDQLSFGYRNSNLHDLVVTEVELALRSDSVDTIKDEISRTIEMKRCRQPLGARSAGCVFRNPGGGLPPAGALIDQAGLKGYRIGKAMVSTEHANFFVNLGRCSFRDMLCLIESVREEILRRENILLEREVRIWI